jgi:hypothetical protein
MSKWIGLLTAAVMLMALAGCASEPAAETPNDGFVGQPTAPAEGGKDATAPTTPEAEGKAAPPLGKG